MQKIVIYIMLSIMVVGTLAAFLILPFSINQQKKQAEELATAQAELEAKSQEYSDKIEAQRLELSKKHYSTFAEYKNSPDVFEENEAEEKLIKKDLKVGTGEEIKENTVYAAYYIGWNPDGKVFDSSFEDDNTLKSPLSVEGANMIEGWSEGVIGMKKGGIRELTIPSSMAYGEEEVSAEIPPNTPLKFVVMVISKPETIKFEY